MLYVSYFHYSYWHTVSQVSVMGKQVLMTGKDGLGGSACFIVKETKEQQKSTHTSTVVCFWASNHCRKFLRKSCLTAHFGVYSYIHFPLPFKPVQANNKGAGTRCLSANGQSITGSVCSKQFLKRIANMTRSLVDLKLKPPRHMIIHCSTFHLVNAFSVYFKYISFYSQCKMFYNKFMTSLEISHKEAKNITPKYFLLGM